MNQGLTTASGQSSHDRYWIGLTAFLLVVALAQAFRDIASWHGWSPDFLAYWASGTRLREGFLIYLDPDGRIQDPKSFIYPPVFAALFAPLTWFPRESVGQYLWAALHLVFAGVFFWKLLQLLEDKALPWQFAALLMTALLVPLTQEMMEGQVNLVVMMLFACGLVDIKRGKDLRGGLWFALAAHLKVIPIVVLLVLLVARRAKAAKGMAFGLLGFALLPLVWTVPNQGLIGGVQDLVINYLDFLEFVFLKAVKTGAPAGFEQYYFFNNSGHAVLHRWFDGVKLWPYTNQLERGPLLFSVPEPVLKTLGYFAPLAMYGACCLAAFKRKGDLGVHLVLAFMAAQFLNILFWEHHLLSLGLLVGVALAAGATHKRVWLAFAPFAGCLTLPFVIGFALLPAGSDWPETLLTRSRIWGLPTIAFLVAWGVVFRFAWKSSADVDQTVSQTVAESGG